MFIPFLLSTKTNNSLTFKMTIILIFAKSEKLS